MQRIYHFLTRQKFVLFAFLFFNSVILYYEEMHVTSAVIDKLYRSEQKKHNSNTHINISLLLKVKTALGCVSLSSITILFLMYIWAGTENASLRTLTKSAASHQTQLQNFSGWQSNPWDLETYLEYNVYSFILFVFFRCEHNKHTRRIAAQLSILKFTFMHWGAFRGFTGNSSCTTPTFSLAVFLKKLLSGLTDRQQNWQFSIAGTDDSL